MLSIADAVELPLLALIAHHPERALLHEVRQNLCAAEHGAGHADERIAVFRLNRLQPINPGIQHEGGAGGMLVNCLLNVVPRVERDLAETEDRKKHGNEGADKGPSPPTEEVLIR